jgi:hypothetical protein
LHRYKDNSGLYIDLNIFVDGTAGQHSVSTYIHVLRVKYVFITRITIIVLMRPCMHLIPVHTTCQCDAIKWRVLSSEILGFLHKRTLTQTSPQKPKKATSSQRETKEIVPLPAVCFTTVISSPCIQSLYFSTSITTRIQQTITRTTISGKC